MLEEKATPTSDPLVSYIIGLDVIGQKRAGELTPEYLAYDGHGSVRMLIKDGGTLVAVYDYDAYGNAIGFNPTTAETNLLYTGEFFDKTVEQYVLRARYYDASIGRFSSFDAHETDESLHKYLYANANPVYYVDPTGNFFDMIELVSTMGINNMQNSGDVARSQPVLTIARSLNTAMKFYNGVSSAWDTLQTLAEFTNLADLSAAERAAFQGGLSALNSLGLHVNLPKIEIHVPQSLVSKIHKKVGPLWDTPPMQGFLGAAVAALVTTMLGWETTDIAASYTGVDAIMKIKSLGVFAVVEAKGGSGKLDPYTQAGKQMYDRWIESRVNQAIDKNPSAKDTIGLKPGGPLIAAIFSTDLTAGKPYVALKVQTYPGIKSWGVPFE